MGNQFTFLLIIELCQRYLNDVQFKGFKRYKGPSQLLFLKKKGRGIKNKAFKKKPTEMYQ
jgi:hypothetical protein